MDSVPDHEHGGSGFDPTEIHFFFFFYWWNKSHNTFYGDLCTSIRHSRWIEDFLHENNEIYLWIHAYVGLQRFLNTNLEWKCPWMLKDAWEISQMFREKKKCKFTEVLSAKGWKQWCMHPENLCSWNELEWNKRKEMRRDGLLG